MSIRNTICMNLVVVAAVALSGCAQNGPAAKTEASTPPKSAPTTSAAAAAWTGESVISEKCTDGSSPTAKPVEAGVHFGPVFKLSDADAIPVGKVLADRQSYAGKHIRVTGRVSSVCAEKGCWLTFGDAKSEDTIFIKFADPASGRLVPLNAPGHEIIAEGVLKEGNVSEAFARDLVLDAGGSREDSLKVVGPQKKIVLLTPAVTILGVK